jgi:hypothetical protein
MPAAKPYLGCQILVDKPASRPYIRAKSPIFGGSSHLDLRLVDMGGLPVDYTGIDRSSRPSALPHRSPHARFVMRPQLLTRV